MLKLSKVKSEFSKSMSFGLIIFLTNSSQLKEIDESSKSVILRFNPLRPCSTVFFHVVLLPFEIHWTGVRFSFHRHTATKFSSISADNKRETQSDWHLINKVQRKMNSINWLIIQNGVAGGLATTKIVMQQDAGAFQILPNKPNPICVAWC